MERRRCNKEILQRWGAMLRTIIFSEIVNSPNLEDKIRNLNEILQKEPENIKALEELGAIYYYQKKDDVAIEIYEKLSKLEPENSNIRGFLGYLYYETDQFDKAIENLNTSLDLSPDSAFVYFVLGNAYSRAGKIKDAVDSYDFAIFLDLEMQHILILHKNMKIWEDLKEL